MPFEHLIFHKARCESGTTYIYIRVTPPGAQIPRHRYVPANMNPVEDDTHPKPDHSFPVAPAPWKCKGEFFWFLGFASSSTPYPPRDAFNDLEADSSCSDPKVTGEYRGGLTHIMVVRYKETPVGTSSLFNHSAEGKIPITIMH